LDQVSWRDWAVVGLLAAIALALGIALHPLAVDDAFITYRYAHNLAAGNDFTYNMDRPVLSTTAPLWALALAAGALLWPDIPALANTLSAVALAAGALFIFVLGRRERMPWVGALAALLYILCPLLWLSLGLETAAFLALALGAVLAYRSDRLYMTAVLMALATLTRADGLILAAVLAADYVLHLLRARAGLQTWVGSADPSGSPGVDCGPCQAEERARWGSALGAAIVYVIVMLPLLAWLTWKFGSPLPATLAAKRAQVELGVTGFYAHTTYLQGLGILLGARLAQSEKYALFIPAIAVGLVVMWKQARWVRLLVAWGAVHLLGYMLLGVTPYYWYYAPLVPGLVCAVALGIIASVRWLGRKGIARLGIWGLGAAWVGLLILALIRSDWAIVRALDGPVPPPEDPVSKVLPEAKADPYRLAGYWLRDHTPPDALVGVTEVGVMGYYAGRPMLDFLGLLEPDVAEALARGDLYWALLRYQPDYLVLTGISPLYAYDLRADPWFQAAYLPVETFDDPRFWGSPLTVYERRVDRQALVESTGGALPEEAIRLDAEFGSQIRLLGAVTGKDSVQPGDVLALTLYWEAGSPVERDYTVFVHLLGEHERVIAQRDTAPGLGARPTSQWTPGQVVVDPYLLALPEAAYAPDEAVWEVGLYDAATGQRLQLAGGGDNVRFGVVSVRPAGEPLRLDFGPVALVGYELDRLALTPGETLRVTLYWEGEGPAKVSVQLVSEQGEVAVQAGGELNQKVFALTLPGNATPDAYDLEVLVVDPATGQIMPLLGVDGQSRSDRARLTKVRVYP
jgi:hypothetical protein